MKGCVLVVDDDDSIREFVRASLTDEGYEVFLAENGADAFDVLHQLGAKVCLILLDLKMPVMDGYEFLDMYCEQVGHHAPVIAVSAHTKLDKDGYCITEFLPKPFDLDILLNRVNKYTPYNKGDK